jgi:uncharacterized protein (DUF885 family)
MKSRHWFAILGFAGAILVAAVSDPTSSAQTEPAERLNPQFEQFIDRYLAGGGGRGRRGEGPNDLSAASFEQRLTEQRALLKDLQAFDRKSLSFDEDIDYRVMESSLKSDIMRGERVKRWQQDPRQYLGANINYKLEADPRAPDVRGRELVNDLKLLQARLANGKKNLTQHIPRWVELSHDMLDGLIVVVDKEVPAFASRLQGQERTNLTAEAAKALTALKDFKTFLTADLAKKPQGDYKIGAELYNALHETQYMFPENDIHLRRIARGMPGFTRVPAFHDWGWKQFKIVEKQLEVQARKIDPDKPWLKIIREMKEDHPSAEALVYAHHEAARRTREWVIEKDLVSIPWQDDDSIMVAADPSRWSAQWWGFGPGVPTGSRSRKSAWTIIPINPDWDEKTAEENLTEKDYSFMWAIATHEVYPGHHLQSLWRNENKRKLRRSASSYSNQSWCYYIEWELTPNYGFYPKEKQDLYTLEMLRLKLWRMGRVIIDSGLHTGRMSYDDAVTLESETIGFVRRGGQINVDGITSGGSGTAAPTLGYFEWMLLREDYFKKMRELDQKGTLKDFPDRVYKIGFLPVTLVREALFHELELEFRPKTTSTQ